MWAILTPIQLIGLGAKAIFQWPTRILLPLGSQNGQVRYQTAKSARSPRQPKGNLSTPLHKHSYVFGVRKLVTCASGFGEAMNCHRGNAREASFAAMKATRKLSHSKWVRKYVTVSTTGYLARHLGFPTPGWLVGLQRICQGVLGVLCALGGSFPRLPRRYGARYD